MLLGFIEIYVLAIVFIWHIVYRLSYKPLKNGGNSIRLDFCIELTTRFFELKRGVNTGHGASPEYARLLSPTISQTISSTVLSHRNNKWNTRYFSTALRESTTHIRIVLRVRNTAMSRREGVCTRRSPSLEGISTTLPCNI